MGNEKNALATQKDASMLAIEQVLMEGDLAKLNSEQRITYVNKVCESLGLNPLTRPFEFLRFNGKVILYARKDATDQLRDKKRVSIEIVSRETVNDVLVVTARARTYDGRTDECVGALSVKGLSGEALANAMMKAETKAKRRVTLSVCGLGFLDETDIQDANKPNDLPWDEKKSDFAPSKDPLDLPYEAPAALPWETEPVAEAEVVPEKEHELASFVIPGGVNKGIKLSEKPDAFWSAYLVELKANISKVPADRQEVAQATIDAIGIYLDRK